MGMAEYTTNEVIEKLFRVYESAMDIAIDIASNVCYESNYDMYACIDSIHNVALDIADNIEYIIDAMEKLFNVKIPAEIRDKMRKLNEEYEKKEYETEQEQ